MNVKIFRLKSGEELLAKYVEKEDHFQLEKPMIIIPQENGNVGFAYFMPYTKVPETGIDMPKSYIAFEAEVLVDMLEQYETLFDDGPKLVLPKQEIITG